MKAKPYIFRDGSYHECSAEEATDIALHMEGAFPNRMIPVIRSGSRDKNPRSPVWTWNGDTEKPTLRPSIHTSNGELGDVCHVWVNDGMVQYLPDCTHEFKGTTRPLLDVE